MWNKKKLYVRYQKSCPLCPEEFFCHFVFLDFKKGSQIVIWYYFCLHKIWLPWIVLSINLISISTFVVYRPQKLTEKKRSEEELLLASYINAIKSIWCMIFSTFNVLLLIIVKNENNAKSASVAHLSAHLARSALTVTHRAFARKSSCALVKSARAYLSFACIPKFPTVSLTLIFTFYIPFEMKTTFTKMRNDFCRSKS